MRVSIRITPSGDGGWRWALGRAGVTAVSGRADTFEQAQEHAEDAARSYAEDCEKAQHYLYDTDTRERVNYKAG